MDFILIHPADTVKVCLENGHKYAARPIARGETIVKYGFPIGVATEDIPENAHVHTHNMKTALSGEQTYAYRPQIEPLPFFGDGNLCFPAYHRKNGQIGIRNDIWILPTVACVNGVAEALARRSGAFAFPHPYGCSQLGDDQARTQKILCGLIRHPNAGGVLVLGLGCENNQIQSLQQMLGDWDEERVRFLQCQDEADELAAGEKILAELKALAAQDSREPAPLSRLTIGLKCGGSDGFSGLTANPLCGKITDRLLAAGGTTVLTEVPEMFGAEPILLGRCQSRDIFTATDALIRRWKEYYLSRHLPISENPSPGNRAGGITTLEEKSLGCVQKGGKAPVSGVLDWGDTATGTGLQLLTGPGNDPVAVTNLTAAGCHLILFTTGRGTPLGAPVPTIKIASNTALAQSKPRWIDFDAQKGDAEALWALLLRTAAGEQTKNEANGYREIAIFKEGVTL